jgi:hypothetical protein
MGNRQALVFVVAMVAGMAVFEALERGRPRAALPEGAA